MLALGGVEGKEEKEGKGGGWADLNSSMRVPVVDF